MFTRHFIPLTIVLLTCYLNAADKDTEIFPLEDVERGMLGEWRTVIAGTKIETFKLRVLGVQQNFAGPQRAVIICEALDDENKLSGPVAGMSGSPVYIKKKLVGAYAYGFMMSKEQAIIGVTPIEQMLEVAENYGPQELAITPTKLNQHQALGKKSDSTPTISSNESRASLKLENIQQFLKPVPTPLFVSGFSPRTLKHFEEELAEMGMDLVHAPVSGTSSKGDNFDPPLVPGAPVAGVLMDGDFSMSGVGTITWRKGNRLLGFGHPFMQEGPVHIPMAGAEVLTVVRSVSRSFKLSNVGPIKGMIYQDRLTAIAGEIGREAPCTKVTINIHPENGPKRTLRSNLFCHKGRSPTFCAMALLESINSSMDTEAEQSFEVTSTLQIDGHDPLVYYDSGTGGVGVLKAAMGLRSAFREIVDNPFETPMIREVNFDVRIRNQIDYSILKSVTLRTGNRPRGGDTVKVGLELARHKTDREVRIIEIPIPKGYSGERLVLFIGDADSAARQDVTTSPDITGLNDILNELRLRRDNRRIFVKLLRRSNGLALQGASLPDLPASIQKIYSSDSRGDLKRSIRQTTVWETSIPVRGEFQGSYSYPLDIR